MTGKINNPIADALGEILSKTGFKKKSDTWLYEAKDTITVINLQKSQYGQQYYVNAAIWVKALGQNKAPKENQCHIRFRLSSIVPEEQQSILSAILDLEKPISDESERSSVLSAIFEKYGLPLLNKCMSLDGLKKALDGGDLEKALVQTSVRELYSQ